MTPETIVNLQKHPIEDLNYTKNCKVKLDLNGALVMENFLTDESLNYLQYESRELRNFAYFCHQDHNAYLLEPDPDLPDEHIRNLAQISDKGCVTHDQIPVNSPLRILYEWSGFRGFLEVVLANSIFPYTDTLSSININYFERGQQLGWHYDNASFAVTLMVQAPEQGGEFQYLEQVRNFEESDQGFAKTEDVVKGRLPCKTLTMGDGALVLFRGRNSLHRVAPVTSDHARILVTLNFNTEPGVMLSELARMTFFGRLE